ncbi:MAG: TetR-like C-terminal domain-containing protein [Pseudomonadota bacterium]
MAHETTRPYHHGKLREELLAAAEAELEAGGLEGFSLRRVAKRAGVSHAAPTHHFGDTSGLLTALAAVGFARFLDAMETEARQVDGCARAKLIASGRGYIRFALKHPALFRLMFSSGRPDPSNETLRKASRRAFDHLVGSVGAMVPGAQPARVGVIAAWAAAHGVADLASTAKFQTLADAMAQEHTDAATAVLELLIPQQFPAVGDAE